MKLKFLFFVMALSAMGPGRDAPPPDADSMPRSNPARLPPIAQSSTEPTDPVPPAAPEASFLDAADVAPEDFLWKQRPIVVFADTPGDPAFVEQLDALQRGAVALAARDAVVILDTDPAADSVWRRNLHPRGFSLVLIDKDGQIKIRRPSPWDVREIGRAIDRLPLRRQEIGRGSVLR
ncbi:MAG: DUF4174 domain-containing protein [Paracoccus sp. (in: a-proteobacteria)]|uniref:DUF4174 domain-containing protein n=1 Tax=Paracoccus sp. TaxID=267 RepID=UPI003241E5FC